MKYRIQEKDVGTIEVYNTGEGCRGTEYKTRMWSSIIQDTDVEEYNTGEGCDVEEYNKTGEECRGV